MITCTRLSALVAVFLLAATGARAQSTAAIPENPTKQAYFGDLHLHTALSLDSYVFGNRNDPDTAYRFAQGEKVPLYGGETKQLKQPLDFLAVTDHAEYMGELLLCTTPGTPEYDSAMCVGVRKGDMAAVYKLSASVSSPERKHLVKLCGEDGAKCREGSRSIWQKARDAAARYYKPGKFSTLIGFEFSPGVPPSGKGPAGKIPGMMHRNVIFRTDTVPDQVFSAYDGSGEQLQAWLEKSCTGPCRVLTIPHNMNFSWGHFFWEGKNSDGSPWTRDVLERRARIEPLVEIFQIKGGSECQFGVGLTDEECGFENAAPLCPPGAEDGDCAGSTSFARDALVSGLRVEESQGINPFKYGIIAATDNHNALAGGTEEGDYKGAHGAMDSTPAKRLGEAAKPAGPDDDGHGEGANMLAFNPGGLAAVWAEKNTREAIWDALARRETFGTSGTRIRVRFFGSFDFPEDLHKNPDLVKIGYAQGVPMGGDLKAAPEGRAPRFVVWATRDPDSAPLQKIQIVKGWVENGKNKAQVFDVACSDGLKARLINGRCPDNGAQVDLSCKPDTKKGAAELSATWTDPTFDPKSRAVYYVRVLENPTCRWSTFDALRLGRPLPQGAAATVKERAWTSPIWYEPG